MEILHLMTLLKLSELLVKLDMKMLTSKKVPSSFSYLNTSKRVPVVLMVKYNQKNLIRMMLKVLDHK